MTSKGMEVHRKTGKKITEIRRGKISEINEGEIGRGEGKITAINENEITEIGEDQIAEINARLAKLEADLDKAMSGYRLMLIKENPDILPELISGGSIEEVDKSLETAKALTSRIKTQLEAKTAAEKIPAGAPPRTPPNIENLDSHGKIMYGLEKG